MEISSLCFRWKRILVITLATFALNSCALAPGSYFGSQHESVIKLPKQKGDYFVPEYIEIREITADLIIEMFEQTNAEKLTHNKTATKRAIQSSKSNHETNNVNYKLGPGDIISVIVWDHPELTTPAGTFRAAEQAGTVVAEDGTIFYPYVGVIKVSGLTTRQVRKILTARLAKYIEKVQLDVRMAQFRSKRVYVVGEVSEPGTQEITDIPMTVLEAVNRAGGFTQEADFSRVLLTRSGTTYRIDIQMMYEQGATEQNALLESGDIVNVMDRSYNKIFVLGEVNKPGSLLMNKKRSTLAEALSDAGYVRQDKANPSWIYVMRGEKSTPELFHLDGQSPDAMLLADRFPLRPRDIVYVDVADIVRVNRVIANILPTSHMLNLTSGTRYPLFGGRQ
ncbi:MAG: polysaccharide export protein [Candidatus Thiodiazotropha sp.]